MPSELTNEIKEEQPLAGNPENQTLMHPRVIGQGARESYTDQANPNIKVVGLHPGVTAQEIQKALDSLDAQGGGVMHLAQGTYYLTTGISIPSYVTLEGEGRESTILEFSGLGFGVSIAGTGTTDLRRSIRIRDLAIQNSNATAGLDINYAETITLQNITVFSCDQDGIRARHTRFMACYDVISNNHTGNAYTLVTTSDRSEIHVTFVGCFAESNGGIGWSVTTSSTANVGNLYFFGCRSNSNTGDGFDFAGTVQIDSTLVACMSSSNSGIGYDVDVQNVAFLGCFAESNTGDGFEITDLENKIIGCKSEGNGTEYDFQSTGSVTFVGNNLDFGASINPSNEFSAATTDSISDMVANLGASPPTETKILRMKNVSGVTISTGSVVTFGIGAVFPATAALPSSANVVSRWPLNEVSGNATDSVGSNNLTDTNTVGSSTNNPTNGFVYSRDYESTNSEYHDIADNASLSLTGSLTIAAWVNPESFTNRCGVVSKFNDNGVNQRSYHMGIATNGIIECRISGDGTNGAPPGGLQSVNSVSALSTASWQHIAFVFEAATRMEVYINGASEATTSTNVPTGIFDGTANFSIGRAHAFGGSGTTYYDGLIQDAILWNTALTDANITSLYALYSATSGSQNGDEITTTTTAGDTKVCGMALESITSGSYGSVLMEGKTALLKVDGTTDITVGDYLSTFTTAGIAAKASSGQIAFAIALEPYTTNDSNGVIDALLIKPRQL